MENLKRWARALLAFLLIQSILCADALAIRANPPLHSPQSMKITKLISTLGSGPEALLAVRLKDESAHRGYVAEVDRDSFLLVDPTNGEQTRVSITQISRLQGVNVSTGVQVSHGTGIRGKLIKVAALLLPHKHVQGNALFGTTALLVGVVLGIILAIVVAKAL